MTECDRSAQAAALVGDFVAAAVFLRARSAWGAMAALLPPSLTEDELPERVRLMTCVGSALTRSLAGLPVSPGGDIPEVPAGCIDTQIDDLVDLVVLFARLDWRT